MLRGTVCFKIIDGDIVYDIKLDRNITVVAGLSATGKTTLCKKLLEYNEGNPSIEVICDKDVICLTPENWKYIIN